MKEKRPNPTDPTDTQAFNDANNIKPSLLQKIEALTELGKLHAKFGDNMKGGAAYLNAHPEEFAKIEDGMHGGKTIVGDAGTPVTVPTKVYRVELANGHGPFNSGRKDGLKVYEDICCKIANCADLAEGPCGSHEQCGITDANFKTAHGCADYACASLDAVKRWFSPAARQYIKDKLHARCDIYELPVGASLLHLLHDEVVFAKTQAKLVGTLDIVTLEEVSK